MLIRSILNDQGAYPAHGQAIARTTVLRFPAAAFQELLRESPALATNLIVALSQLLLGFAGLVDALALHEVSARVAKYLLDLSLRLGSDSIALDVNKRALAARLGTVPETLSRTLRRFREEGIITVDGARIQILDRTRLEQAAAGMRA
jgi:CRP-like cAMP-binding protein